jgi:hypothetical protein
VLDRESGSQKRLNSHQFNVVAIAVINCSRVATGDENGLVVLWDVPTELVVWEIKISGAVYNLTAVSGGFLCAGVNESTMVVLDAETGGIVQQMHETSNAVYGIAVIAPE